MTPHCLPDTRAHELSSAAGARYTVSVALPPGYAQGGGPYPLLLVLDGNICCGIAADTARAQAYTGEAREIIVAAVSIPAGEGLAAYSLRRLIDFSPNPPQIERVPSPIRELIASRFAAAGLDPEHDMAGGPAFLDFLRTLVLPMLRAEYRIAEDETGLFGHSASGCFAAWTLLQDCPDFNRYIIGSYPPAFEVDTAATQAREQAFVASRAPRDVRVLSASGGHELDDPELGAFFRLGQEQMARLAAAGSPGLAIHRQVFQEQGHASVMAALLASGIHHLWNSGLSYSQAMRSRE